MISIPIFSFPFSFHSLPHSHFIPSSFPLTSIFMIFHSLSLPFLLFLFFVFVLPSILSPVKEKNPPYKILVWMQRSFIKLQFRVSQLSRSLFFSIYYDFKEFLIKSPFHSLLTQSLPKFHPQSFDHFKIYLRKSNSFFIRPQVIPNESLKALLEPCLNGFLTISKTKEDNLAHIQSQLKLVTRELSDARSKIQLLRDQHSSSTLEFELKIKTLENTLGQERNEVAIRSFGSYIPKKGGSSRLSSSPSGQSCHPTTKDDSSPSAHSTTNAQFQPIQAPIQTFLQSEVNQNIFPSPESSSLSLAGSNSLSLTQGAEERGSSFHQQVSSQSFTLEEDGIHKDKVSSNGSLGAAYWNSTFKNDSSCVIGSPSSSSSLHHGDLQLLIKYQKLISLCTGIPIHQLTEPIYVGDSNLGKEDNSVDANFDPRHSLSHLKDISQEDVTVEGGDCQNGSLEGMEVFEDSIINSQIKATSLPTAQVNLKAASSQGNQTASSLYASPSFKNVHEPGSTPMTTTNGMNISIIQQGPNKKTDIVDELLRAMEINAEDERNELDGMGIGKFLEGVYRRIQECCENEQI